MTSGTIRRDYVLLAALLLALVLTARPAATQVPQGAQAPADSVAADSTPYSASSALIRSLILPGWGQAYVGAHGRGALYFALEGGSLWMLYKSSRALADARELESYLRENDALAEGQRLSIASSRAQQVEDWITLSVFWALFAGADAYVSAQLADFVGHVGALPGPDGEVRFQVRMNVGGAP
ncbi:MAG TPA: DUF5683 domain-containing protein [Longimicrobiaceae bacterium]